MEELLEKELLEGVKALGDKSITYDPSKSIDENMKANGVNPDEFADIYFKLNSELLAYNIGVSLQKGGFQQKGGVVQIRELKYKNFYKTPTFIIGVGVLLLAGGALVATGAVAVSASTTAVTCGLELESAVLTTCTFASSRAIDAWKTFGTVAGMVGFGQQGAASMCSGAKLDAIMNAKKIIDKANAEAKKTNDDAENLAEEKVNALYKEVKQTHNLTTDDEIKNHPDYIAGKDAIIIELNKVISKIQYKLDTADEDIKYSDLLSGFGNLVIKITEDQANQAIKNIKGNLIILEGEMRKDVNSANAALNVLAQGAQAGLQAGVAASAGGPAAAAAAAAGAAIGSVVLNAPAAAVNVVAAERQVDEKTIERLQKLGEGEVSPPLAQIGVTPLSAPAAAPAQGQAAAPAAAAPAAAAPAAPAQGQAAAPAAAAPAAPAQGQAAAPAAPAAAAQGSRARRPPPSTPPPSSAQPPSSPLSQGGERKQMGGEISANDPRILFIALVNSGVDPFTIKNILDTNVNINKKGSGNRTRTYRNKMKRSRKYIR